jgi:hypothetical protein
MKKKLSEDRILNVTMLSEFIKELQKVFSEHGDMPITSYNDTIGFSSPIYAAIEPFYYDGGWTFKINTEKESRYYRSRYRIKEGKKKGWLDKRKE